MVFANPNYLYLLLLIPMIQMVRLQAEQVRPACRSLLVGERSSAGRHHGSMYLRHVPFVLRHGSGSVADRDLGPSAIHEILVNSSTEGIDIMLAMDISGVCWRKT